MNEHDDIAEAAEELNDAYKALESRFVALFGVAAEVAIPNSPANSGWLLAWRNSHSGWGLFIGVPGNFVPATNACLEARVLGVGAVEELTAVLVAEQDEKVDKVKRAAERLDHLARTVCR